MYEQLQTHCSDRQSLSEDRRLHGTCSPSCPPWSEGTSHLMEQLTGKETLPSPFCPSFTHGLHLGAIPALLLSSLSRLLLHCTATPANQLPMLLADRYASKQSHSSPFSSLPPCTSCPPFPGVGFSAQQGLPLGRMGGLRTKGLVDKLVSTMAAVTLSMSNSSGDFLEDSKGKAGGTSATISIVSIPAIEHQTKP